MRECCRTRR